MENYNVDSDMDDYEWEHTLNEEPLPEINKEFRQLVLDTKHKLYTNTVISGKEGTEQAQNNNLIRDYLRSINNLYVISLNMQKKENTDSINLSVFPENTRESIELTLNWIRKYFSENNLPDTIPYKDYIQKSFHEYPYVQSDNFIEDS